MPTSYNQTVAIKGTGKSLGLTDGSNNLGIAHSRGGDNWTSVIDRTEYYNSNVGTGAGNYQSTDRQKVLGVTTDASKSGLTGSTTISRMTTQQWIIKY